MDNGKDGEHSVPQSQKRLTFFQSFEEEQLADLAYWKSLTPEQKMEVHRQLSLIVFSGFEKYTGNRLTFDFSSITNTEAYIQQIENLS